MATLGSQLRPLLLADATVAGLVGSRIFPDVLPEGIELPAVVYTVVDDVPENALAEPVSTRLKSARVQIDCYDRDNAAGSGYEGAHELADAVNNVVGNLSDPALNSTAATKRDLYDNETGYYRVSMDFTVWHS